MQAVSSEEAGWDVRRSWFVGVAGVYTKNKEKRRRLRTNSPELQCAHLALTLGCLCVCVILRIMYYLLYRYIYIRPVFSGRLILIVSSTYLYVQLKWG